MTEMKRKLTDEITEKNKKMKHEEQEQKQKTTQNNVTSDDNVNEEAYGTVNCGLFYLFGSTYFKHFRKFTNKKIIPLENYEPYLKHKEQIYELLNFKNDPNYVMVDGDSDEALMQFGSKQGFICMWKDYVELIPQKCECEYARGFIVLLTVSGDTIDNVVPLDASYMPPFIDDYQMSGLDSVEPVPHIFKALFKETSKKVSKELKLSKIFPQELCHLIMQYAIYVKPPTRVSGKMNKFAVRGNEPWYKRDIYNGRYMVKNIVTFNYYHDERRNMNKRYLKV